MGWLTGLLHIGKNKTTLKELEADNLEQLLEQLNSPVITLTGKNTADAIARSIVVPQLANIRWGVFKNGEREKAYLHKKLNYSICRNLTGYEFWAALYNNLLQYHNAYAELTRNAKGELVNAELLPSNEVIVSASGKPTYKHKGRNIARTDIWHLKLHSWDGYRGKSFDSELAIYEVYNMLETLAKKYGETEGTPKRFWKVEEWIEGEQQSRLLKRLQSMFAKNSTDEIVPPGVTPAHQQISARDGQFVEQRNYNRNEILWLHGINPEKVDMAEIYRVVMSPILENVSQSIYKHLLSPSQQARYNIKPIGTSRYMGDLETLVELAGKLKQQELATTNELRKTLLSELGLGAVDGGDTLQNPYTGSEKERERAK